MMKKTRKKKRAYIIGPMRGYSEFNFPAFHAAAKRLRALNWEVFSPAERDEQDGFNPKTHDAKNFEYYMSIDLPEVCKSDVITALPEWESSEGAITEAFVAVQCKLPVLDADTLQPLNAKEAILQYIEDRWIG